MNDDSKMTATIPLRRLNELLSAEEVLLEIVGDTGVKIKNKPFYDLALKERHLSQSIEQNYRMRLDANDFIDFPNYPAK